MTLGSFLATYGEPLQIALFFGLAAAFLGVERWRPARPRPAVSTGRRWLANGGLLVLNFLLLGAMPVTAVGLALWAEAEGWGLLNVIDTPPAVAIGGGVLLRSLVGYFVHRAFHRVPWLWRLHRVHHSDPHFDVTTTVRVHPLEFLLGTIPAGLAIVAFGISPVAILLYEAIDAAIAVVNHANVRLPPPIEGVLRTVLVTPDLHRVHHSRRQAETDSNYGVLVPWWDWIFGTYVAAPAAGHTAMAIGLDDVPAKAATSLGWLLLAPLGLRR